MKRNNSILGVKSWVPFALIALIAVVAAFLPRLASGGLVHRWSFNDGTANDSVGTAHGSLYGGATIADGYLVLNGTDPVKRMETAAFGHTLGTDKTLVAWFTLNNPADGGTSGGPLSVENQNGNNTVFDAIAYGERTSYQWMNGSDMWYRTPASNGGALETAASTNEIMMVVVYDSAAGNKITLYRNGALYGQHNQGTLASFSAAAVAVIGPRVSWADGQAWGYLNGKVNEAQVYSSALTAEQVAALYATGPDSAVVSPANGDFETGTVGLEAPHWTRILGSGPSVATLLVDSGNLYYPDTPQGSKMVNLEMNAYDWTRTNYPVLESEVLGRMEQGKAYTFCATAVSTAEDMAVHNHCSAYRFSLWDATAGEEVAFLSGDITTSSTTNFVTFTTPVTEAGRAGHLLKVRLAVDGNGYTVGQRNLRLAVDAVTVEPVTPLAAADGTWMSPADGSWLTASNWSGNTLANGTDAVANFSTLDITADTTVTLDWPRGIGHLIFGDSDASHDWLLKEGSGGPLMLTVTSGSPLVTVSNRNATLALEVTGGKGLVKDGAGTLTLADARRYKGAVAVREGTLKRGDSLVHRWSFNDGTANDSAGTAHGTLYGTATITNGALRLSGSRGTNRMETAAFGSALGADKTLVVWCTLDDPVADAQSSGSPLSIVNSAQTVMDAIVYGEETARQWMNGSDMWYRTPFNTGVGNGGALETAASTNEIMMVIVYDSAASNKIKLYRNGALYAQHSQGALVSFEDTAKAVFGPRHTDHTGVPQGYLNGKVNEARVYRAGLTAAQVVALYAAGPDNIPQMLPSDTSIAVTAGATLDLTGGGQTVAALSGAGTVANGAVTVTGILAPGDAGSAGTLTVEPGLSLPADTALSYDYTDTAADTVHVSGTLTIQETNTVTLVAIGAALPPSRVTLFTFSALAGADPLGSWKVEGLGLSAYKVDLEKNATSLYLRIRRVGTLFSIY